MGLIAKKGVMDVQSSGSIGGRPIGSTLPFLEKIISGSIGGTL